MRRGLALAASFFVAAASVALASAPLGGCECRGGEEAFFFEVTVTDATTGALVDGVTFTTVSDGSDDSGIAVCNSDPGPGRVCPVWVFEWNFDAVEVSAPGYLSQALDTANIGSGDWCAGLDVSRSVKLTPKP